MWRKVEHLVAEEQLRRPDLTHEALQKAGGGSAESVPNCTLLGCNGNLPAFFEIMRSAKSSAHRYVFQVTP
jgi:hypothetical protein